jgi:hypothetical protein
LDDHPFAYVRLTMDGIGVLDAFRNNLEQDARAHGHGRTILRQLEARFVHVGAWNRFAREDFEQIFGKKDPNRMFVDGEVKHESPIPGFHTSDR